MSVVGRGRSKHERVLGVGDGRTDNKQLSRPCRRRGGGGGGDIVAPATCELNAPADWLKSLDRDQVGGPGRSITWSPPTHSNQRAHLRVLCL